MIKPEEKIDIGNTTDEFKKFVVKHMIRKRPKPLQPDKKKKGKHNA